MDHAAERPLHHEAEAVLFDEILADLGTLLELIATDQGHAGPPISTHAVPGDDDLAAGNHVNALAPAVADVVGAHRNVGAVGAGARMRAYLDAGVIGAVHVEAFNDDV